MRSNGFNETPLEEDWKQHPTRPLAFTAAGMVRAVSASRPPRRVHAVERRLFLEAMVGPPPTAAHQAVSLNGRSDDVRIDNVQWMTRVEFIQLRRMHGTYNERPHQIIEGVKLIQCGRCGSWLPEDKFYPLVRRYSRHGNILSQSGRNSECKRCSVAERSKRRRVTEGKSKQRSERAEDALALLADLDGLASVDWASIGPRLYKARRDAGLTRVEAGKRAKVNQQTIEQWEHGRNVPRREKLLALIHVLRDAHRQAAK